MPCPNSTLPLNIGQAAVGFELQPVIHICEKAVSDGDGNNTRPAFLKCRTCHHLMYWRFELASAQFDGAANPIVDAAAAKVIGQMRADILIRGITQAMEQALSRHNHPGRAETALSGLLFEKGLLQGMQVVPSQPAPPAW